MPKTVRNIFVLSGYASEEAIVSALAAGLEESGGLFGAADLPAQMAAVVRDVAQQVKNSNPNIHVLIFNRYHPHKKAKSIDLELPTVEDPQNPWEKQIAERLGEIDVQTGSWSLARTVPLDSDLPPTILFNLTSVTSPVAGLEELPFDQAVLKATAMLREDSSLVGMELFLSPAKTVSVVFEDVSSDWRNSTWLGQQASRMAEDSAELRQTLKEGKFIVETGVATHPFLVPVVPNIPKRRTIRVVVVKPAGMVEIERTFRNIKEFYSLYRSEYEAQERLLQADLAGADKDTIQKHFEEKAEWFGWKTILAGDYWRSKGVLARHRLDFYEALTQLELEVGDEFEREPSGQNLQSYLEHTRRIKVLFDPIIAVLSLGWLFTADSEGSLPGNLAEQAEIQRTNGVLATTIIQELAQKDSSFTVTDLLTTIAGQNQGPSSEIAKEVFMRHGLLLDAEDLVSKPRARGIIRLVVAVLQHLEREEPLTGRTTGLRAEQPPENTGTGLEEAQRRIAAATKRYEGLFKNGTELVDNEVIPNLNITQGQKITLEINLNQLNDIDPADIAAMGRIFTHGESIIPVAWRRFPHETLPPALNQAAAFLAEKGAGAMDLALVDPKIAADSIGEWSTILEDRKTPGILMTPAVLSALDRLKDDARDLAIVLAAIRQSGGIVLGFQIQEKAGQRTLYLYA